MRFDIGSFTATLGSAKLRLYGGLSVKNNASIQVEVHDIPTNTWTEPGVKWNNKPAHSTTIEAVRTVVGVSKTYYEWDLTSYISSQRALGKTVINLKLINSGNNLSRIDFNSKEATVNRPQLVLTPSSALGRSGSMEDELKSRILESVFVYPNPARTTLFVDLNELKGSSSLRVMDVSGRSVLSQQFEADKILDLDISNLKNGLYILEIQHETGKVLRRFVVE